MDTNDTQTVVQLAEVIAQQVGENTMAIDVKKISGFTDFLIITSVQSFAQLQGVMNRIDDFLREHGIESDTPTKRPKDDQWACVDCGFMVIHIMRPEARSFYELEQLWHEGTVIYSQQTGSEED